MIAGVELRKERRLSEVLTDSFNILFAHWKQVAIIAVPLVVANVALSLVALALAPDLTNADELSSSSDAVSDEELEGLLLLTLVGLLSLPIILVLYQLVGGAIVVYLDESDKDAAATPADALDRAQTVLGALVGAALRSAVIVVLLAVTIIGLPWAIMRAVRWLFLQQAIMLDGKRGQEVLASSASLVKGRWWNTLGRILVAALVMNLTVGLLAQALLVALPGVLGTILSAATGFVSIPYLIIAISLMYFDLKSRKGSDDVLSPDREPAT